LTNDNIDHTRDGKTIINNNNNSNADINISNTNNNTNNTTKTGPSNTTSQADDTIISVDETFKPNTNVYSNNIHINNDDDTTT